MLPCAYPKFSSLTRSFGVFWGGAFFFACRLLLFFFSYISFLTFFPFIYLNNNFIVCCFHISIHFIFLYLSCTLLMLICLVSRVFSSGPEALGSIPGRVIPKNLEMVLDTSLLNTQQYKVSIQGKVKQSRERSSAFPYT